LNVEGKLRGQIGTYDPKDSDLFNGCQIVENYLIANQ